MYITTEIRGDFIIHIKYADRIVPCWCKIAHIWDLIASLAEREMLSNLKIFAAVHLVGKSL